MNHTQLINYLIEKYNLKSYLEIGVQSVAQNFDKIKCDVKYGVDPAVSNSKVMQLTSDDFFTYISGIQNGKTFHTTKSYDLIFIDGLHHTDQVERDFNNSLKCLNDGGFIVIHDTCPTEEQYTTVPRQTKQWFGNVFSFAMNLSGYRGINFITLDQDCGITVVWKIGEVVKSAKMIDYTWNDYVKYKNTLLHMATIDQFEKLVLKEGVT